MVMKLGENKDNQIYQPSITKGPDKNQTWFNKAKDEMQTSGNQLDANANALMRNMFLAKIKLDPQFKAAMEAYMKKNNIKDMGKITSQQMGLVEKDMKTKQMAEKMKNSSESKTEQKKENAMLHSSSSGMEKYNTFNKGYYSQAQIDAMKAKEAQASQKKVDNSIKTAESKTGYNSTFAKNNAENKMNDMAMNMLGDKPKTDQVKTETGKYEISKDGIKAADQFQSVANKLEKGKTETKTDASKDKKEVNSKTEQKEGKKQEGKTDGTEKKETKVTPKTVEQRIKEMEKSMNLSEDEKKKMTGMEAKNVNALQYDMSYYLEKNKNATQEEKDAYKGHLIRKYGAEGGEKKDEKLPEKKEDQKVKEGNNTGSDKGMSGQRSDSFNGYKQEDVAGYKQNADGTFQIATKDGKSHNMTQEQAKAYYDGLPADQQAKVREQLSKQGK